jgi:hypothetical protein
MKKALTIFIGFVHDWAAGCWAATVLGVWWLSRYSGTAAVSEILFELKKQFFYAGLFCVVLVFATGTGRTFTYVGNVYGEDAEKIRRKMLIIKHIMLLSIFGAGTCWQYFMTFG